MVTKNRVGNQNYRLIEDGVIGMTVGIKIEVGDKDLRRGDDGYIDRHDRGDLTDCRSI